MATLAFLYRWTELSTGMWYEGSRTKKGCHPLDNYICSSDTVKLKIIENPANWKREVLCIGDPIYIRELETSLLVTGDAAHDSMSYNEHNSDGKFHTIGKDPWNKGTSGLQSAWNKGTVGICKPNKGSFIKGQIGKIGEENGMYGKESWNKGKTGIQNTWNKGKTGIQEAWNKGTVGICKPNKGSFIKGQSSPVKGKTFPNRKKPEYKTVTCPYCLNEGGGSNMARYHFDNCKHHNFGNSA